MATVSKINLEEYLRLQEAAEETIRYELDEGELLETPSPTLRHNEICFRIRRALADFGQDHHLGFVTGETDFQLAADTVRKPDVAFLSRDRMKTVNPEHSPVEGPPSLAVEIISPSNSAQETAKKVRQYLAAGCQSVWLVYPGLRLIEIHDNGGAHDVKEPAPVTDALLPGFSLSLTPLLQKWGIR